MPLNDKQKLSFRNIGSNSDQNIKGDFYNDCMLCCKSMPPLQPFSGQRYPQTSKRLGEHAVLKNQLQTAHGKKLTMEKPYCVNFLYCR